MKKVMILGAGIYQVPLIKKIREMGHQSIVVSPSGDYPGIKFADVFIDLDTKDKDKILEEAIKNNIDAILTTGTDVAVVSIGYVVDHLGLVGTGYDAALRSMDKALMKKCFYDNGVQSARFSVVESFSELELVANEIGYPIMVKAVDSSGSRGINQVLSVDGLINAYNSTLAVTKSKKIVVEQFLDGYEIGAQAVVINDEVVDIFLHGDTVTPPPVSVPIGHSIPLNINVDLEKKINNIIKNAIKALGIKNTISNVDIMIVDNEPYVIEVAARMGATCLAENISVYTGFDLYEYILLLALGEIPKLPEVYHKQANAALLIKAKKTGVIQSISIPPEVSNHPKLLSFSLDVCVGSLVKEFTIGPDRIGHIIVKSDTSEEAIVLADRLSKLIDIDILE